jgi:type IV pilus assembly protein PilW
MVGIVVGMVGLLVIYKTLSVWDMRTRSTTAGGDAQVGGTIAMYSLERSIKLAGMGFGVAPSDVMGCTVTGTDTLNARALSFALYPLQIVPGVPAGSPDTINVLTGNSSFFVTEGTFNVSTATTKKLVRRDGFRSGDVAVVAGNGATTVPSSSDCRLIQITDNTAPDGATVSHASGALVADPAFPSASGNSQFNDPGGTGTTFSSGTIYNLGPKPSLMRWQVAGGRVLTGTDYLQGTPAQQVADGVISIKAEYGVDLDKDTIIEASEWTTATPTDWTLVRAVRVALLMRVGQFEKPESSSASAVAVTNAAPFWTHGDGTTTPFLMTNVDGSADSYGPGDVNANNVIWGTM